MKQRGMEDNNEKTRTRRGETESDPEGVRRHRHAYSRPLRAKKISERIVEEPREMEGDETGTERRATKSVSPIQE